jgi:hypothetical protein
MIQNLEKLWRLLFPAVEQPGQVTGNVDRSAYERFAIPFTFQPRLSLLEAAVAAIGAFLRILLGCLLFAVWGTYTLFAWSLIHSPLLRLGAVMVLLVLFLFSLALLLVTIAFLTRLSSPKRNGTVIPL